jgi:hypothetical protein
VAFLTPRRRLTLAILNRQPNIDLDDVIDDNHDNDERT